MKHYKNHISVGLFLLLFLALISGQCFGRAQYLKVNNETKDYDIRVDQVEEFYRTAGTYNEGEYKKFDLPELTRIEKKGEAHSNVWWFGAVAFDKNFDYPEHEATLHILKKKKNDKESDVILGSKKFKLSNSPDYSEQFNADGKLFTIKVKTENPTFWEGSENSKYGGVTYSDYIVTVTAE